MTDQDRSSSHINVFYEHITTILDIHYLYFQNVISFLTTKLFECVLNVDSAENVTFPCLIVFEFDREAKFGCFLAENTASSDIEVPAFRILVHSREVTFSIQKTSTRLELK